MFAFHVTMVITSYFLIILFCVLFFKDTKYRDDIILGTTIPSYAQDNPGITDICRRFRKAIVVESILMALLVFPIFFIDEFSIVYSLEMTWFLATMIVPYLVYYRYFKELRAYKKEYNLIPDDGSDEADAYWFREDFYYNKNDKNLTIQNRYKIGATVNLARPAGKILAIIVSLLILSCPVPGIFMYIEDHTPIKLELTDSSIEVSHLSHECTINYSEITTIELMYTLPKAYKITGYNSDCLYKGYFNIKGQGRYNVYMNPEANLFLRIETAKDGYIVNIPDSDELKQIYDKLIEATKK